MWHCRQKSELPRPPFRDGPFCSISEHTYRHKHGKCSMSGTVMLSSIVKPHCQNQDSEGQFSPKQYREDTSNSVKIQKHFKVFTPLDGSIESLHSIAIKDVATPEIPESHFSMEELGQSQLYTFDEERLVNATVKFRDRLPKSNSADIQVTLMISQLFLPINRNLHYFPKN